MDTCSQCMERQAAEARAARRRELVRVNINPNSVIGTEILYQTVQMRNLRRGLREEADAIKDEIKALRRELLTNLVKRPVTANYMKAERAADMEGRSDCHQSAGESEVMLSREMRDERRREADHDMVCAAHYVLTRRRSEARYGMDTVRIATYDAAIDALDEVLTYLCSGQSGASTCRNV